MNWEDYGPGEETPVVILTAGKTRYKSAGEDCEHALALFDKALFLNPKYWELLCVDPIASCFNTRGDPGVLKGLVRIWCMSHRFGCASFARDIYNNPKDWRSWVT